MPCSQSSKRFVAGCAIPRPAFNSDSTDLSWAESFSCHVQNSTIIPKTYLFVSGEFLGAAIDRPWADGAVGHPLPHAGQHLHQRHSALPQVGPGQRAPGMLREYYIQYPK